jgi:hypothetical protein
MKQPRDSRGRFIKRDRFVITPQVKFPDVKRMDKFIKQQHSESENLKNKHAKSMHAILWFSIGLIVGIPLWLIVYSIYHFVNL